MKHNTVITIGRQCGSGGHEIAKGLADALSIPFYDKEIITEAAKKSGMHENLFKQAEERTSFSFLYSVAMGAYNPFSGSVTSPLMDMNESIFQMQAKVITDFAAKGPCVFVGRAADYVLREADDCCRVFIYGDLSARRERISRLYGLDAEEAEAFIQKTDKKRANFYQYYTGQKWNNLQNYDVCISSTEVGVPGAVEMILSYLRLAHKD